MTFENPNINTKEHDSETVNTQDVADFFANTSAEEIAKILKQKESQKNIEKNLAEIAEEQKDLDKRISSFESTLKSPTKNVDDKGATTQEDVDKLRKKKEKLATQEKRIHIKKPLTQYVKDQIDGGYANRKKELEEIQKELALINDRIAQSKNYESKSEFSAADIAVGKENALIKKKDAMERDITRLQDMVLRIEKAQKVKELMNGQKDENVDAKESDDKESKKKSTTKETQDLDGWTKEEKDAFDKEFQDGWDKKLLEGRTTEEKKSQDTDMNEEEKFDKEVDRRKQKAFEDAIADQENLGDQELADQLERDRKKNTDELKAALDDTRRMYTSTHYKSEGMLSKIKSVFSGNINTEHDQDVVAMKEEYRRALEDYRQAKLHELEGLSENDQKKALLELKAFDLNEKISLFDDRLAARAETKTGKIFEVVNKSLGWYKGLSTRNKIALSGFLLVGGMAAGTGVAAGIFGAATLGKRILGSGVAGMGATGWAEGRAQRKEDQDTSNAMESFREMSLEEQKSALNAFDNASFDKLEKEFHGKVAGRRRRVTAGIGTAAAVMGLGAFSGKVFAAGEVAESVDPHMPESGDIAEFTPKTANVGYEADIIDDPAKQAAEFVDNTPESGDGSAPDANVARAQMDASQAADNPEQVGYDINDTPDSGDRTVVDTNTAEAQSDASQLADNPEQGGWNGEGSGVSIDQNGIGTLEVNKGGSIEGSLIAFFKANSDRLTAGGMGWDPDKFKDVNEWAGKRAHGLVEEYMKAHPGIDMNTVQPGTTFEIDLNNTADIRIGDVDFEGGVHIVPDQEKIKFAVPNSETVVDAQQTAESSIANESENIVDERVKTELASQEQVAEVMNAKERIMQAFDISKEEYAFFENQQFDGYVKNLQVNAPESDNNLPLTPVQEYLIEISQREGFDSHGQTVGKVLENAHELLDSTELPSMDPDVEAVDVNSTIGKESMVQSGAERLRSQAQRMNELAQKMNIENDGNLSGKMEGGVFTEIDGQKVPDSLMTEEEKSHVETARRLRDMMNDSQTSTSIPDTSSTVETMAGENPLAGLPERELISELNNDPEFRKSVGGQIREIYGMPAQNVGRIRMGLLEGNNPVVQQRVDDVIMRAKQQLGEVAGTPRDNTTVGTYFTRIFAQAVQKGKVKEIFPSSDFQA